VYAIIANAVCKLPNFAGRLTKPFCQLEGRAKDTHTGCRFATEETFFSPKESRPFKKLFPGERDDLTAIHPAFTKAAASFFHCTPRNVFGSAFWGARSFVLPKTKQAEEPPATGDLRERSRKRKQPMWSHWLKQERVFCFPLEISCLKLFGSQSRQLQISEETYMANFSIFMQFSPETKARLYANLSPKPYCTNSFQKQGLLIRP
jgi:hypothetical protein